MLIQEHHPIIKRNPMTQTDTPRPRLAYGDLLQLKRWNTPTIYNGWEQITRHDASKDGFNIEETRDFMPHMGPMIGYAVTVVCEPSNRRHPQDNPNAWSQYRAISRARPDRRSWSCRTSTNRA